MAAKKKTKQPSTNAFVISQYFGFDGFDLPEVTKDDIKKAKSIRKGCNFVDGCMPPVEEHAALLRHIQETDSKEKPLPLFLYSEGQPKGGHKKKRRTSKTVSLSIVGTPKSIAEAILIKTAQCILKEEGYKDVTIKINSVGNKDAQQQFLKEINQHYRKYINQMNATCRQSFKDGVHSLVTCGVDMPEEFTVDAPQSMSYLTDEDRRHFKEVVEFLESQDVPYEIDPHLLGDPHYSNHTVFSIVDSKTGAVLAKGSRFDILAKKIGNRKGLPSAHATITIPKLKKAKAKGPNIHDSKFYFIQIGPDAKRKSLHLIDQLREANVPVYQSLSRDRLSTQLQIAARKKFPYVIIMGQKEAQDNTVTVRDMINHSQVIVPVAELVKHLKKLK